MNKNKKTLIIVAVVVVILLIIAGIIAAVVITGNNQTSNNQTGTNNGETNGGNGNGANFANFRNAQGKILTVSNDNIIVDQTSGQTLVGWDQNTVYEKTITVDKAQVLVVGQTVQVRYTTDTAGNSIATSISKIDSTILTQQNTNRGMMGGNGGNGSNRGTGNGTGSRPTFNAQAQNPNRERTAIGQITAVDGTKLTISSTFGNGGFRGMMGGTNGTNATPNPSPTATSLVFDLSKATYTSTDKASLADLKVGLTVQVTGTLAGTKIVARNIIIE